MSRVRTRSQRGIWMRSRLFLSRLNHLLAFARTADPNWFLSSSSFGWLLGIFSSFFLLHKGRCLVGVIKAQTWPLFHNSCSLLLFLFLWEYRLHYDNIPPSTVFWGLFVRNFAFWLLVLYVSFLLFPIAEWKWEVLFFFAFGVDCRVLGREFQAFCSRAWAGYKYINNLKEEKSEIVEWRVSDNVRPWWGA